MGVTFPQALKSDLRQDIEVALVGENPDMETASIAFDAANTGHKVTKGQAVGKVGSTGKSTGSLAREIILIDPFCYD